jgi:branched-chain amino acid transport system substrate-binding protein
VGQNQTLRRITQDQLVAMIGSYHSSVTLTATAVSERYGIPILVADSVALDITQRGFKWTFRTTPIARDFAKAYTEFLTDLKTAGKTINSIAVVNENTDYGTSVAASILDATNKAGIRVVLHVPYSANSTDVSAQVLQLMAAGADAMIFVSYTADTILYMKTLKTLDYLSPIIIGDDAGFSDPAFILAVGDIGQGVIGTSASQAATPLGSTRCSRQRPAGILTIPARVGFRAFWSSPTPSTARALAILQRSGRRCGRPT